MQMYIINKFSTCVTAQRSLQPPEETKLIRYEVPIVEQLQPNQNLPQRLHVINKYGLGCV